jgi:hypothetical protein
LKNDLYFTEKLDEHITEIKFVSGSELMKMKINYVTKRAFMKNALKNKKSP